MNRSTPTPVTRTGALVTAATVALLAAALAGTPDDGTDTAGYGSGVRKGHPVMGYLDPL